MHDITRSVLAYQAMVDSLHLYDEELEASNLLVERDIVLERLHAGARLSSEQAKLLKEADNRLQAQWRFLLDRFPSIFDGNAEIPREYWWWHLNEGPQVREEATASPAGR